MKDKEKQIEEMASKLNELFIPHIGYTNDFMRLDIAQELLKHYQPKIPEDSVVLSREEYGNKLQDAYDNGVEWGTKWGSKETAEKIIEELCMDGSTFTINRLTKLANKYDLDIREILRRCYGK